MLRTAQRQSWVDSGLPCWLTLLVLEVLVVPVHLVVHLAEVAGPAAGLGAQAVGLAAAAAGPLRLAVAAEPDWPVVAAAAGVAAD